MLDGWAKSMVEPALDRAGAALSAAGLTANQLTVAAFAIGLGAAAAIASEAYLLGLLLILLSRLGDGLDGAVARAAGATDLGGYLDIVLDFAFYGAIPLAFVLVAPQENAVAGAVLLLSFYVNGASFLAFAAIAQKRGLSTERRGRKSLYFTSGLAEGSETLICFCLFCLFPDWFAPIALLFAGMCFWTAAWRVALAARTFR